MNHSLFGFTVREVAFMRSLSEPDLMKMMQTLREIRTLPTTSYCPPVEWF